MLRGITSAVLMLCILSGMFLVIDRIHKRFLRRLFLSIPNDGSFDPNDPPALSSVEVHKLRQWEIRRWVFWCTTIFAFGFVAGYNLRNLSIEKGWFLIPLLALTLINDFLGRCPRCKLLMIRQCMVRLPKACLKCGVGFKSR